MTKRIRVLRLIDRLNVGGPAQHVVWLTEGLDRDRYETRLVTGRVAAGETDMAYFARDRGVEPVFLEELSREIGKGDLFALLKILREIREFRPDIIHTHKAKAGTLGRTASWIYRWMHPAVLWRGPRPCRVVHTFHGHVLHSYYGARKSALFAGIERLLARFATDRIVVVSQQQRQELCGRFRIGGQSQYRVVPLGVDFDAGPSTADRELGFERPAGGVVVGAVGRLTEVKNYSMLIEVTARLKAAGVPLETVFVGDGNLHHALVDHARELGVLDSIIFTGFRKDTRPVYKYFDVFALTSLNEGTPLTAIEALGCGVPVISTEVGGVVDLMGAPVAMQGGFKIWDHGITAPSRDTGAYAAGLGWLLEHGEARSQMGQKGSAFVRSRHSRAQLVQNVASLYRELIETTNAPR